MESRISDLHTDDMSRTSFDIYTEDKHFNKMKLTFLEKEEPVFDKLLNDVGLSTYNIKIYAIMLFFYLADGAEMIVLSMLASKLGQLWDLSTTQKASLGSAVFIGFMLGTAISGMISDKKGRKPTFLLGATLVTVFAFLSAFAQGYISFLLIRALCGFGIGISVPASFSLSVEITPTKYRSYVLNCLWVFFPIGEVYVIFITKNYIEYELGWRYILAFTGFPCLFALCLALMVDESPRFLLTNKYYNDAFNCIDKIISQSNTQIKLTDEMKKKLIAESVQSESNKIETDYSVLLKPEYKQLSYMIWSIFFTVSFIYYGLIYILPQTLEYLQAQLPNEEKGDMYIELAWIALSEVPAVILAGYLPEVEFFGRKHSMSMCYIVCAVCSFASLIFSKNISFLSSIIKLAVCFPFNIAFLYTVEAYPTKIRTIGLGVANSFTRFGGVVTPLLTQVLFSMDYRMPFVAFFIASVYGFIACLKLPFETRNRTIE
jgi:MFS family permease